MSKKLIEAIKSSGLKYYIVAKKVGMDRVFFSLYFNRRYSCNYGDANIIRLAELMNVPPEEAFEIISRQDGQGDIK
jgi:cyanate lyase